MKLILVLLFLILPVSARCQSHDHVAEAPRIVALLEQGLAAERGIGIHMNPTLAIGLYCDAAGMGSAEAYFRIGRILAKSNQFFRNPALANTYLALAARLGHHQAVELHNPAVTNATEDGLCREPYLAGGLPEFDIEAYISGMIPAKQKIAALISQLAPRYGVEVRMALAIALAESNLEPRAVSSKNAQGVMQLIPETQARFGVQKPFNPDQNIRGGLAYLKWLHHRFGGNPILVAAAYNAGEGVVERYGGVPPYPETRQYVRRVLHFSGMAKPE